MLIFWLFFVSEAVISPSINIFDILSTNQEALLFCIEEGFAMSDELVVIRVLKVLSKAANIP